MYQVYKFIPDIYNIKKGIKVIVPEVIDLEKYRGRGLQDGEQEFPQPGQCFCFFFFKSFFILFLLITVTSGRLAF